MSRFIELPVDGEKHLFNADTIFEVEPMKSGCRVYQTVYAPGSIDFTNVVVGESYEQVKAILAAAVNVSGKVTGEELQEALHIERSRCKCALTPCDKCEWHSENAKCDCMMIADYINKRLKGE